MKKKTTTLIYITISGLVLYCTIIFYRNIFFKKVLTTFKEYSVLTHTNIHTQ